LTWERSLSTVRFYCYRGIEFVARWRANRHWHDVTVTMMHFSYGGGGDQEQQQQEKA
jgi:hypothetical protein